MSALGRLQAWTDRVSETEYAAADVAASIAAIDRELEVRAALNGYLDAEDAVRAATIVSLADFIGC